VCEGGEVLVLECAGVRRDGEEKGSAIIGRGEATFYHLFARNKAYGVWWFFVFFVVRKLKSCFLLSPFSRGFWGVVDFVG
jgi:hypothetical protein